MHVHVSSLHDRLAAERQKDWDVVVEALYPNCENGWEEEIQVQFESDCEYG